MSFREKSTALRSSFTDTAAMVGAGAGTRMTRMALTRVPMALKFVETFNGSKKKNAMSIVLAISEDKNRTIQQIADAAGVSKRTATRYIKEFQDAGVLMREGSDISGEWILS